MFRFIRLFLLRYEVGLLVSTIALVYFWPQLASNLFNSNYVPHGSCYLWIPDLVMLHVVSDTFIGLSYFAIATTLVYLVYKTRRDIPFAKMFIAFGLFIITCGTTHLISVWTLWEAVYWLSGGVKLITAVASIATAVALPAVVPKIFDIISEAKLSHERKLALEKTNLDLSEEIIQRKNAQEEIARFNSILERRVRERTSELEEANRLLKEEIAQRKLIQEEREQLLNQTRRHAAEMDAVLESIPDALFIGDDKGLLRVNRNGLNLLGINSLDEIKQNSSTILEDRLATYSVEDGKRIENKELPFVQAQAGISGSREVIFKDRYSGNDIVLRTAAAPIYLDKKIIGAVAISTDITEKKVTEMNLRYEKNFNEAIINSLPGIFYLFDSEGKFVRWNNNFLEVTGYSREEIAGMDPLDFFDADEKDYIEEKVEQVFTSGRATAEASIKGKSGKKIPYFFTGARLDVSEKVFVLGMGLDITERKETEEKVKQFNEQLEKMVNERTLQLQNANKELEAFSYSVSHDLRAPLRSIDGFSLSLLEEYQNKLDSAGRFRLERIRIATQRMGHLIDDILNLSRLTRSDIVRKKVDMSEIAESIAEELRRQHPDRQVTFDIQKQLVVNADPDLLGVMLENLLGNAFKFTSNEESALIRLGATILNGKDVYYIKDNGAGFDETYKDKLFIPFQRLHSTKEFEGTGIGLALVQRIVNKHGGRIWAESKIGQGAVFFFTLHDR